VKFLLAIGLLFLLPAFVPQLAFDPTMGQGTGSVVLQAAALYNILLACTVILSSRETRNDATRCKPLIAFLALPLLSTLWSMNWHATLQASFIFTTAILFGVAMVGRLSMKGSLRLATQVMSLACFLSVVWVVADPQIAVHQESDLVQNVHAGLWRGIFSHKQALGLIAGLTTGMILFYGPLVFPNIALRFVALGCSLACLIGSGSVTGLLTVVACLLIFQLMYRISLAKPAGRKAGLRLFFVVLGMFYLLFHYQLLNFLMPMLGKSEDLTGRASFWPYVLSNINNSSLALIGGGLAGGWEDTVAPSMSVDNGYIDLLISVGYLGAGVVLAVHGWIFWRGTQLVLAASGDNNKVDIFPTCYMIILLFINISEPTFMSRNIYTVLTGCALYQVASQRRKITQIQAVSQR
jgi:exopolysaccharide production protein ExoQ